MNDPARTILICAAIVILLISITLCSCSTIPLPGGHEASATLGWYKESTPTDPDAKLGLFIERKVEGDK